MDAALNIADCSAGTDVASDTRPEARPTDRPRKAVLFDIQRFSIHDGPGIRTTLFFKGCALRCAWCQNPESLSFSPEIAYYPERCIECLRCVDVCEPGAIDPVSRVLDWTKCSHCGKCAEVCPSLALRMAGALYTKEELLDECAADRAYFEQSGGGITLSGGEPVLQHRFLKNFLPMLKEDGFHVLLQTAGMYRWESLEGILPYIDRIYYDIKSADPSKHREWTGSENTIIIENLRKLLSTGPSIRVRVPMIPGYNDTEKQLHYMAEMFRQISVAEITLLKYNHLWESKTSRLSSQRPPLGIRSRDKDFAAVKEYFARHGIAVTDE